jgi:hexosaminidase
MSWRGIEGGQEAIRQGHDAVMTPGNRCYLDKVQDAPVCEPEGFGGYLPIDSIYVYDPAAGIPEASLGHLLGVQGNLWHELIPQPSHTEYMLYPRAFAIAEIGWSPVDVKDAVDFRERATAHASALRERGYNTFKLEDEVGNRPASRVRENHLGRGAKVVYAQGWNQKYPAAGAATLTDGNLGGWSYGDGRWQGFQSDVDVTVDLGRVQPVHYVTATFLADPGAWIYLPDRVSVEYSVDGEHFTLIRFRPEIGTVKVDRTHSGFPHDIVNIREFPVSLNGGVLKLRVIMDRYSLEVFVNDGEQAASFVLYTPPTASAVSFSSDGSVLVDVEKYDLEMN